MSEKAYLVTGAAGHLGNTIIKALRDEGKCAMAMVMPGEKTDALRGIDVFRFEGDLRDAQSVRNAVRNAAIIAGSRELVVIHAAGLISIKSRHDQRVREVNFEGTRRVIDACREYGAKRLVYVSSVHAIPEKPDSVLCESKVFDEKQVHGEYAKSKALATNAVLAAQGRGLDVVVVHPSGIIGPGDFGNSHMTQMISDYMCGKLVAYFKGGYDFVDVRDVAKGVIAAADKGEPGACYILSGRYIGLPEMMKTLHDVTGKREVKTVLPVCLVKAVLPLAEMYYKIRRKPPLFTKMSVETLCGNVRFDCAKAKKELGYNNTEFKKTLADTVEWLKKRGRV